MIPEFGHFALILALALSGLSAMLGLVGAHLNRPTWEERKVSGARALDFVQVNEVARILMTASAKKLKAWFAPDVYCAARASEFDL